MFKQMGHARFAVAFMFGTNAHDQLNMCFGCARVMRDDQLETVAEKIGVDAGVVRMGVRGHSDKKVDEGAMIGLFTGEDNRQEQPAKEWAYAVKQLSESPASIVQHGEQ